MASSTATVGKAARTPKGARTREAILGHALALATRIGVEGVTIGRLAEDLKMSKSGLFAHFKSKEALQIEMLRMRYAGLHERMRYERNRHGQPSMATLKRMSEVGYEWAEAESKLKAEVESINGRR